MDSSLSNLSSSHKNVIHVDGVGKVEIRSSKRAKNLRLAVSARKGAYVIKPRRISSAAAKRFVVSQEKWLQKQVAKLPERIILRSGDKFSRTKELEVIKSEDATQLKILETSTNLELVLPSDTELENPQVQQLLMKRVVKVWRSEAKTYLPRRLEILAKQYGFEFKEVRVKYMHTRWGSCSSRNNINLNIQLMRLEPELIDHVLIHELCHTREHNHSKAFWELFESCEPGAKTKTKELKKIELF